MKKIIALFLCLVLVFSFSACKGKDKNKVDSSSANASSNVVIAKDDNSLLSSTQLSNAIKATYKK